MTNKDWHAMIGFSVIAMGVVCAVALIVGGC